MRSGSPPLFTETNFITGAASVAKNAWKRAWILGFAEQVESGHSDSANKWCLTPFILDAEISNLGGVARHLSC
jgi:hypothetical protein